MNVKKKKKGHNLSENNAKWWISPVILCSFSQKKHISRIFTVRISHTRCKHLFAKTDERNYLERRLHLMSIENARDEKFKSNQTVSRWHERGLGDINHLTGKSLLILVHNTGALRSVICTYRREQLLVFKSQNSCRFFFFLLLEAKSFHLFIKVVQQLF